MRLSSIVLSFQFWPIVCCPTKEDRREDSDISSSGCTIVQWVLLCFLQFFSSNRCIDSQQLSSILRRAKMATNKSCACLSLHKSARIIGTVLFLITVGLFVAYLIFIEDLRRSVVEVRLMISSRLVGIVFLKTSSQY